MNEILKQRLVGALILLALGVVFWPIIFVEQNPPKVEQQPAIPPPPQVATEPVATPDAQGMRASPPLEATSGADAMAGVAAQSTDASTSGAITSPVPAVTAPAQPIPSPTQEPIRQDPPEKLALDKQGVPVAWTLQVATVSSADKAEALRRSLLDRHHKAYITQVASGGKTLYRVCIGPKFERAELEKLQASINAEFGVTTMVVRYLP